VKAQPFRESLVGSPPRLATRRGRSAVNEQVKYRANTWLQDRKHPATCLWPPYPGRKHINVPCIRRSAAARLASARCCPWCLGHLLLARIAAGRTLDKGSTRPAESVCRVDCHLSVTIASASASTSNCARRRLPTRSSADASFGPRLRGPARSAPAVRIMRSNPYEPPAADAGSASPGSSTTVSRVQSTFSHIARWVAWLLMVELSGFAGLALGVLLCIYFSHARRAKNLGVDAHRSNLVLVERILLRGSGRYLPVRGLEHAVA
jgi:hypothetical protein